MNITDRARSRFTSIECLWRRPPLRPLHIAQERTRCLYRRRPSRASLIRIRSTDAFRRMDWMGKKSAKDKKSKVDRSFWSLPRDQSIVKSDIVAKCFYRWALAIIAKKKPTPDKIAYIDLFAGPGRYDDGTPSTPLRVLQVAIKNPSIRQRLYAIFNDAEEADKLQANVDALEGVEMLAHKPIVRDYEVGPEILDRVRRIPKWPALVFLDPFGYKGLSIELVGEFLKGKGTDVIIFFNYRRINAATNNDLFTDLVADLFGPERAADLREATDGLSPEQREPIVIDAYKQALEDVGGTYVKEFCFKVENSTRTSHYLIGVSKHPLGYKLMKDVMGAASSTAARGVPSFAFDKKDAVMPSLFASLAFEDLKEMLLNEFAGTTLLHREIYERHHVGRSFVERNYKDALLELEAAGAVTMDPPLANRPLSRGAPTLGPKVNVTFPPKPDSSASKK